MAFLLKDRRLDSSGPAAKVGRHHGGFKTARTAHQKILKIEASPAAIAMRQAGAQPRIVKICSDWTGALTLPAQERVLLAVRNFDHARPQTSRPSSRP
jgi:hypothetical protein